MRTSTFGSAIAALAAALAACSSGEGKINVRLVDAPGAYDQINIHVKEVQIHGDDGWQTLGEPDQVWNLLELTGGVAATLVDGATIDEGTYTQLRLVLGPNNTVKLSGDDTLHELKVPSGMQSGVKLNARFDVEENTTRDVYIDFDAHRSIFLHTAGGSEQYILRPVVRAVDRIATGAIVGTLTDAVTGAPLAGAMVTAQTVDASGAPSIVRAVQTGADGKYVLDLLPAEGGPYHVVSQPIIGELAYAARASGPISIGESSPTQTYDAAFAAVPETGAIRGDITPPGPADADEIWALQSLDTGGAFQAFLIRVAPATPAAPGETAEAYLLEDLPPGSYTVFCTRRTAAGEDETVTATAPVDATVTAGATTSANLGF
jgi:hypothetical protein